jgi:hypothetical protein
VIFFKKSCDTAEIEKLLFILPNGKAGDASKQVNSETDWAGKAS